MTTLHNLLERYLRVPVDFKEKKSQKLNLFLNKFLSELENKGGQNTLRNMKSVCNILVGEFLVDVHQICHDCAGSDTVPLQEYLLHGRGCVILTVLSTIGVQNVSSGLELAELLVSILPLCLKFPRQQQTSDSSDAVHKLGDIRSSIYASPLVQTSKRRNTKFPQISEVVSPNTSPVKSGNKHRLDKSPSKLSSEKHRSKFSSEKSSSRVSSSQKPKLGRSQFFTDITNTSAVTTSQAFGRIGFNVTLNQSLRVGSESPTKKRQDPTSSDSDHNNPDEYQPETPLGVFRGILSAPSSDADRSKDADPVSDEEIVPLPDLQIDPVELCVLVISIVKQICKEEHSNFNHAKLVSNAILPNIGELLSLIGEEISPLITGHQSDELSDGWSELDYIIIQRHLLRLVFSTMRAVALQANGCTLLRNSQVLNVLNELCDELRKELETITDLPHEFANRKWKAKLEFMVEINEGLLFLFESILLLIAVNPSTISIVLQFLSDYMSACGMKFINFVALSLQETRPSTLLSTEQYESVASRVVSIMSGLTLAMKKMKVSYIHTVKCSRKCHNMCDFSAWTHHHHDVLGVSYMRSKGEFGSDSFTSKTNQLPCSIAMIIEFLLELLAKCQEKAILLRIISSLEDCGICCCVTPETLTSYLLAHLETQTPAIRNYMLILWTRFLLEQCGGGKSNEKNGSSINCTVCDDGAKSNDDEQSTLWMTGLETLSDSAFSSDDNFLTQPYVHNKWDYMQYLSKFVFHEQKAISIQTTQHLLRLVCYGNVPLRKALFQYILVPVFSRALPDDDTSIHITRMRRAKDFGGLVPVSEKVINYCLCALPLLLQCKDIFNMFINIGGIVKLYQYISKDLCRKATLKALMVMVILEERSKQNDKIILESSNDSVLQNSPKHSDGEGRMDFEQSSTYKKDEAITIDMLLKLLLETQIEEADFKTCELKMEENSKEKQTKTTSDTDQNETNVKDNVEDQNKSGEADLVSTDSSTTCTSKSEVDQSVPSGPDERDTSSTTEPATNSIADDTEHSKQSACNTQKMSLLCDLWDCGNVLFHQSTSFKNHFLSAGGTQQAYRILERCLEFVAGCECRSTGVLGEGQPAGFVLVLSVIRAVLSICMSSCNTAILAGHWEVTTEDLVRKVKNAWLKSHVMTQGQGSGFKVMCDMLLSCASQQRLASDLLQNHVFTVMHLKCDDDVYSRHELQELSESSSSQESEFTSLDQGYEADSEFTYDDSKGAASKWSGLDQSRPRTFHQFPVTMPHPQFCHLVLDTLIHYTNKFNQTSLVSHVLLRMISIAKQNVYNATAMYTQGMVELILTRFQQVLRLPVNYKDSFPVELTLLLDLFLVISKHSFHSKELRMCLRLFQEESPPVDLLLHTLTELAENLVMQPSYIICFPVITSTLASDLELTSRSLSGDTLSISVQVNAGTRDDISFKSATTTIVPPIQDPSLPTSPISPSRDSIHFQLPYPLLAAPVQLMLKPSPIWPTVTGKGFSAALWLRVEAFKRPAYSEHTNGRRARHFSSRRHEFTTAHYLSASGRVQSAQTGGPRRRPVAQKWTEQCLHVFSVGNDELLFEVWIDPESCNLVFRVLTCYLDNGEGMGVLAEACILQVCDTQKWHHLTLTFREKITGSRPIIQVSSVIDGCYEKQTELEYSVSRIAYSTADTTIRDNHVYIGHAVSPRDLLATHGSWQLGNFMLFQGLELSKEKSVYLSAMGPCATSLSPCDNGTQPVSFVHMISEKSLLHSGLSPYIFTGNQEISVEQLRKQLLLVYDPLNPSQYQTFDTKPSSQSLSVSAKEKSRQDVCQKASQLDATMSTDLAPQLHRGLRIAISEIGGIETFLFLVAKVIGMETTEELQSQAVKLLFTLLRKCPSHRDQLARMDGYTLLSKALASARCKLGYHTLKVLFDFCLTSSALHHNKPCSTFILNTSNRALIQDADVINHVLLDWRVWQNTTTEVWLLLFQVLENLVSKEHVHHTFNVTQLVNFNIVTKLINICLERIQAEYPSLPIQIAEVVTSVIGHVVKESCDNTVHHMISLWDFLLLVHPAANTFVHHSSADFYFKGLSGRDTVSTSMSMRESLGESSFHPSMVQSDDIASYPASASQSVDMSRSISKQSTSGFAQSGKIQLAADYEVEGYVKVDKSDASRETTDYDVSEAVEDRSKSDDTAQSQLERSNSFPSQDLQKSSTLTVASIHAHSMPALNVEQEGNDEAYMKTVIVDSNVDRPINQEQEIVCPVTLRSNSPTKESTIETLNSFTKDLQSAMSSSLSNTHRNESPVEISSGLITPPGCDNLPNFIAELPSTALEDPSRQSPDPLNHLWQTRPEALSLGSRGTSPGSGVKDDERSLGTPDGHMEQSLEIDSEFETRAWKAYNDVENDFGLHTICSGVLDILTRTLAQLKDRELGHITGYVVKSSALIVMANHCSSSVRAAIIKLLDMYLMRARPDDRDDFLKMDGFHLLANQLYQYPASQDVTEACITLLAGTTYTLGQTLDTSLLQEMSGIQKQAVVPVLALLTKSVGDVALCHNILTTLCTLLGNVQEMLSPLLDSGVCESLISVLQQLSDSPHRPTDLGGDESDILWEDMTTFVILLVQKIFSCSGSGTFQYLEDFLVLLTTTAQQAVIKYGRTSDQEERLYRLLCMSYKSILVFISESLDATTSFVERGKALSRTVGSIFSRLSPATPKSVSPRAPLALSAGTSGAVTKRRHSASNKAQTSGVNQPSPLTRSMSFRQQNVRSGSSQFSWNSMLGGNRRQLQLSARETTDRFKKILGHAVDLVIFSEHLPRLELVEEPEEDMENVRATMLRNSFSCFLLNFIKNAIIMVMEKNFFERKSLLVSMFWQCKDPLKLQICRLFCHMVSPSVGLNVRLFSLALLADEYKCQQLVKQMANTYDTGHKMVLYVYTMIRDNVAILAKEQRAQADEIMQALQQCGQQPIRLGTKLNPERRASIEDDIRRWQNSHQRDTSHWNSKLNSRKQLIRQKYDPLARQVSEHALELTQDVSKAQSKERRKLIEMLKSQMANRLQTKKAWQQLIHQLTHERAVWYDEKSEPKSWQLDPTEGPNRMRKRLQKCKLGIQPRFLTPENRHKLDCEEHEAQLSYLFKDETHGSDSKALIYKLHTSQNILMTSFCKNVTPSGDTPGSILIGQKDVYFVADEAISEPNNSDLLLGNRDLLYVTLPYDEIKGVHKRWYQLQDNALEVFLMNGKTCLFSFNGKEDRDAVNKFLLKSELPNLLSNENTNNVQQLWLEGRITNFEYLCHLNTLSGRSFNDLMQYPVFPFVLAQYTQDTLDLNNSTAYRALEKPIAIQYKEREQRYIEHYNWLEHEQRLRRDEASRGLENTTAVYHSAPFHYGSHYSNSGTVLHFLVRVPPFTQMFLEYQDRNFDIPDRTFHAMETTWRLASFDSTTDVKELIPEFFFFPDFLTNFEGFNFGARQNGQVVNHIHLPKWCDDDANLFVLVHRQALESDFVTAHLHSWIDLVWGSKQKGKAAVDAINVFHPATYFGVDVNKIPDVVNRAALKTAIATYGQTPKQLFKWDHPPRVIRPSSTNIRTSTAPILPGLPNVQGLKWGVYVGSPACDEPKTRWIQEHGGQITSLFSIPTGEVFGLGPCCHLLVMYSKDKGLQGVNRRDVTWAAILSWGNPESVIRIRNKKDKPAVNFMQWSKDEQVTCCASVPDCRLLLFGATSGVITAVTSIVNTSKASHIQVFGAGLKLYGHTSVVSAICVCKPYSVLVSASHDHTLIIWDLNRLSYVRSIRDHTSAVQCVAVSDTSADIASVSHYDAGSTLMLHTVNGAYRGKVTSQELITCLTFSSEPEGRSINVIVAGLSNSRVRMWSTWNLMPVRDLVWDRLTLPIVALTFNKDNQRLFASSADGTVACWERPGYKGKDIVFIPFLN